MKHFYSFAIALLAVILSSAPTTAKGANISINSTNFPDENFRNWLLQQSYGQDGMLTDSEIKGVTEIDVSLKEIKSLKGIEYFTALTELYCDNNQLTSLDVSKNTALTDLFCYRNELTSLDVSGCTALEYLECYSNQLTSLDVSKNTALTWLTCYSNQLTSLDVSKNTALTYLHCGSNQLTSLDVSKNTALKYLICYNNQLTSLDVSKNTALRWLYCQRNKIRGRNMDKLIKSIPQNDTSVTHGFFVIDNREGDEGNVCTKSQVAAVKVKGWTPYYYYNDTDYLEYEGSEDPDYMLGDINDDGKVDVSDYIGVANRILNVEQEGFNEQAGDVNEDGIIDVSDYLGIGNIIHTGSPFGNGASRTAGSRRR